MLVSEELRRWIHGCENEKAERKRDRINKERYSKETDAGIIKKERKKERERGHREIGRDRQMEGDNDKEKKDLYDKGKEMQREEITMKD